MPPGRPALYSDEPRVLKRNRVEPPDLNATGGVIAKENRSGLFKPFTECKGFSLYIALPISGDKVGLGAPETDCAGPDARVKHPIRSGAFRGAPVGCRE